ncbi:DegT/DnrJ/EryC1/StrS family aminotransferase [Eggerthella lenta]|uniref:DegT/DnrJ/EryC1/StrS family aminotransferase n=2 Tax=Eggerthellaceae TaxID=1643826 RepID=UPI001C6A717A|nr:DegT/DnrJ/EryC1/StrS family aminotransferase [Eggerthella lenta]
MTIVPFTNLKLTFELHQEEYEGAILETLRAGWYVLGSQLSEFEGEFAYFLGKKHCIGVGCGLDALILAVRSLDIGFGDEVIVAGNTYIATVLGITENGATPVFVDCNEYYEIDETLIENAITQRTKAVLVTNLYGQCCNLPVIRQICDR